MGWVIMAEWVRWSRGGLAQALPFSQAGAESQEPHSPTSKESGTMAEALKILGCLPGVLGFSFASTRGTRGSVPTSWFWLKNQRILGGSSEGC